MGAAGSNGSMGLKSGPRLAATSGCGTRPGWLRYRPVQVKHPGTTLLSWRGHQSADFAGFTPGHPLNTSVPQRFVLLRSMATSDPDTFVASHRPGGLGLEDYPDWGNRNTFVRWQNRGRGRGFSLATGDTTVVVGL